jgi:hypothetical protein
MEVGYGLHSAGPSGANADTAYAEQVPGLAIEGFYSGYGADLANLNSGVQSADTAYVQQFSGLSMEVHDRYGTQSGGPANETQGVDMSIQQSSGSSMEGVHVGFDPASFFNEASGAPTATMQQSSGSSTEGIYPGNEFDSASFFGHAPVVDTAVVQQSLELSTGMQGVHDGYHGLHSAGPSNETVAYMQQLWGPSMETPDVYESHSAAGHPSTQAPPDDTTATYTQQPSGSSMYDGYNALNPAGPSNQTQPLYGYGNGADQPTCTTQTQNFFTGIISDEEDEEDNEDYGDSEDEEDYFSMLGPEGVPLDAFDEYETDMDEIQEFMGMLQRVIWGPSYRGSYGA